MAGTSWFSSVEARAAKGTAWVWLAVRETAWLAGGGVMQVGGRSGLGKVGESLYIMELHFISVCTSHHSFENWLVKEFQLSHTSRQSFHTSQDMYLYFFVIHVNTSRRCFKDWNFIIRCPFGSTVTVLYFPPLSYYTYPLFSCCTSLYHNIVLLSVIVLHLLSCCTSLCHNIVLSFVIILYFSSWILFYAKLWGDVYFPKLSIRTFCSYYCVLPITAMLYFLIWKLFLHIFTRDRVYSPRLDICFSSILVCTFWNYTYTSSSLYLYFPFLSTSHGQWINHTLTPFKDSSHVRHDRNDGRQSRDTTLEKVCYVLTLWLRD
jgi:hypothetical protein